MSQVTVSPVSANNLQTSLYIRRCTPSYLQISEWVFPTTKASGTLEITLSGTVQDVGSVYYPGGSG